MNELLVNTLIAWDISVADQSTQSIERVLYIIPGSRALVVLIDVKDERALPFVRTYNEITTAIASQEAHLLKNDPYDSLRRPESSIKQTHREIRDKAWERIEPLLTKIDFEFLTNPRKRGQLVTERAEAGQGSKATIYKDLRRFWQRGMIKNAFLPLYDNCGAPGERRLSEDMHAPKLGRKPSISTDKGAHTGIRMTLEIEGKFEKGIKKFYETRDKRNLTDAFDLTIKEFFWTEMEFQGGIFVPILRSPQKLEQPERENRPA